ncbi:hypothetical protein ACWIGI_35980 [Nocardia sp. NPDC055321]
MDQVEAWSAFNSAMVGATAALAGLVIVAASVNIREIIKSSTLVARVGAAMASLVLALVVSCVGLIPTVEPRWYGLVIVGITVLTTWFQVHSTAAILRDRAPENRARFAKSGLGFVPIVFYAGAGVALMAEHSAGLALTAVGTIVTVISALAISWIALVEVIR